MSDGGEHAVKRIVISSFDVFVDRPQGAWAIGSAGGVGA